MGNLIKNKNLRKIIAMLMLAVVIASVSLSSTTITASAKGSWIASNDEYQNLYTGKYSPELGGGSLSSSSSGLDWLGEQIGALLFGIAGSLLQIMADTTGGKITNFTVEGIVFGKIALPAGQNNVFGFDLTDGNYYGIAGATIYAVLRGFAYSGIFIMFLFILARNLFDNSPKARDDLKEGLYGSVIAMVLMAIMPQITEMVLFGRDTLLYRFAKHMVTSGSTGSYTMLTQIAELYKNDEKLIAAILLLATMGGILFYGKDYISIALQQTILFGMFPIFNVLGTNKKKFISDWACTFFSNMAVPLIDVIILWLPYSVIRNADSGGINMIEGIVIVMMLWSSRQVRQEILKMFGNLTNSPVGKGMGGLGQMVQLAKMGAMMGTRAAGAVAGTVASVASSAAGSGGEYGDFGGEAFSAEMDANSLNDMAQGIGSGDMGFDSDAITNPDLNGAAPDLDSELANEFGTGASFGANEDSADYETGPDVADIPDSSIEDIEDIPEDTAGADISAIDGSNDTADTEDFTGDMPMETPSFDATTSDTLMSNVPEQAEMPEGLNSFDQGRWNNLRSLENANAELENAQTQARSLNQNLSRFDEGEKLEGAFGDRVEQHRADLSRIDNEIAKNNENYHSAMETANKDHERAIGEHNAAVNNARSRANSYAGSTEDGMIVRDDKKARGYLEAEHQTRTANLTSNYEARKAELEAQRTKAVEALKNDRSTLAEARRVNENNIAQATKKVDAYKLRESQYADGSASVGQSGRTFSTTAEMNNMVNTRNSRTEAMRQKAATMGIKKEDLRGLTPEARQELAEIQRKNIRTRAIQHGIHQVGYATATSVVAGAIKTTGAVMGAAAFAYGGEDASMAGIQLGSYAGQTIYNKTAGRAFNTVTTGYNHMQTWGGSTPSPNRPQSTGNAAGGRHRAPAGSRPASGGTSGGRTTPSRPANSTPKSSAPQRKSTSATSEAGGRASSAIKLDK